MVAKLHKLTAGDGYTYLTRQVAASDSTERGRSELADYYTEKGEAPGRWWGEGLDGLGGVREGSTVSEAQMKALFGEGRHPNADEIQKHLISQGASVKDALRATQLGRLFVANEPPKQEFPTEVAKAFVQWNVARGRRGNEAIPADERAKIRSEVGSRLFEIAHGRPPLGQEELSSFVAKQSRPASQVVAGFDFTFTPVKSVSALWAVAPIEVSRAIEEAHQAAVNDALSWVQSEVTYTRRGAGGVRVVKTRGLIATAFQHRDSRAGDPNLHTHVAVANKVQAVDDGAWLSLDSAVIYRAFVAASERYDTALEKRLSERLGFRFDYREKATVDQIETREIVGVDPGLCDAWSSRRADIEARKAQLVAEFRARHGRVPTPKEGIALAQQANLETRQAKHEPRALADQRAAWAQQAAAVLGSKGDVDKMLMDVMGAREVRRTRPSQDAIDAMADTLIKTLQQSRARFRTGHVEAAAQRIVRGAAVAPSLVDATVAAVVGEALSPARAVPLDRVDPVVEPPMLRRADGSSMYGRPFGATFTTPAVLAAERRLVDSAQLRGRHRVETASVDLALVESAAKGLELTESQEQLVRELAGSGRAVQLALAPAGSGKTTAMAALADAWRHSGGVVVGLSPTAVAAAELGQAINAPADTLASLTFDLEQGETPRIEKQIGPGTLVLIDEAGMAGTLDLDRAVGYIVDRGASVRLVGDDQQLASISAGGVLVDIRNRVGAFSLTELMRFKDQAEGAATLAIRDGDVSGLGFYLDRGRVHVSDESDQLGAVFAAWAADRDAGRTSLMLAPSREWVNELNSMARSLRLGGTVVTDKQQVKLASGLYASAGDVVITRKNRRVLRYTATDYVRNGDRWVVQTVHEDGTLTLKHERAGATLRMPDWYVREQLDLGYATTVHGAQGSTVDTCHVAVGGSESRQLLYVALTRGRYENHVYVAPSGPSDNPIVDPTVVSPLASHDVLRTIIERDGAGQSATTYALTEASAKVLLRREAQVFSDALLYGAAAEVGVDRLAQYRSAAELMVPGITEELSWDRLQGSLAVLQLSGQDPLTCLEGAVHARPIGDARDRAAVLEWRLNLDAAGPLPWLSGAPEALSAHPVWGPYLSARAAQVDAQAARLTAEFHTMSEDEMPVWALPLADHRDLLSRVAVWRAWHDVDDHDPSLLGRPCVQEDARRYQAQLQEDVTRLLGAVVDSAEDWTSHIDPINRHVVSDPYWRVVRRRLGLAQKAGRDVEQMLQDALAEGPLPADAPAAALWYRLVAELAPAAQQGVTGQVRLRPDWTDALLDALPDAAASQVLRSPVWPSLVAKLEHVAREHRMDPVDVATRLGSSITQQRIERGTGDLAVSDVPYVLAWRAELMTTPPPSEVITEADLYDEEKDTFPWPSHHAGYEVAATPVPHSAIDEPPAEQSDPLDEHSREVESWLDQTAAQRTDVAANLPVQGVARERIVELNDSAAQFYADRYKDSSAASYIERRFGESLADRGDITIGYAPAGWTTLVDHLRATGASDEEMVAAGLAKQVRSGDRVIDLFRDRVMLGVRDLDGQLVGFIGRAAPSDTSAPKYINTPQTAAFTKGNMLFGLAESQAALQAGAIPVRVEGAFDAIAVTLAGAGKAVGLAPLGTSLTQAQADLLVAAGRGGVVWVATDADGAGDAAAQHDFWRLAEAGADSCAPLLIDYADSSDRPKDAAELYARDHGVSLARSLDVSDPRVEPTQPQLAQRLMGQLIDRDPRVAAGETPAIVGAARSVANLIAASRATHWPDLMRDAADLLGGERWATELVAEEVAMAVVRWDVPHETPDRERRLEQAKSRVAERLAALAVRAEQANQKAGGLIVSPIHRAPTSAPPLPNEQQPRRPSPEIER